MKLSYDCLQLKVQQTPRHPDYICLKVQVSAIKILTWKMLLVLFFIKNCVSFNFEENIVLDRQIHICIKHQRTCGVGVTGANTNGLVIISLYEISLTNEFVNV